MNVKIIFTNGKALVIKNVEKIKTIGGKYQIETYEMVDLDLYCYDIKRIYFIDKNKVINVILPCQLELNGEIYGEDDTELFGY